MDQQTASSLESAREPGPTRRQLRATLRLIEMGMLGRQQTAYLTELDHLAFGRGHLSLRTQPAVMQEAAPAAACIQPVRHAGVGMGNDGAEAAVDIEKSLFVVDACLAVLIVRRLPPKVVERE